MDIKRILLDIFEVSGIDSPAAIFFLLKKILVLLNYFKLNVSIWKKKKIFGNITGKKKQQVDKIF